MAGSKVGEWMPLHFGWWSSATKKWKREWKDPVLEVLSLFWMEGFQTQNDPEVLARAAGVSTRAWKAIQEGVGAFFTVKGDVITQEFMEGKYTEALSRSEKFRKRNAENAKAGWERRQQKIQWRAADAANGDASGTTNGNANGIPLGAPMVRDRASSSLLDLQEEEGREDLRANPVPIDAKDPRVLEVLNAYPTQGHRSDGTPFPVHIGVRAAGDIADFMTKNPKFPLLFVVRWYKDRERKPAPLREFLADPPAYQMWKNAWLKDPSSLPFRLSGQVRDILSGVREKEEIQA